MTRRLRIAIPLFPRFTALDAVGPYEVLAQIPAFDITFVGHARGEVRTDNGMLGLVVDGRFEDLPNPDVIVFPGGDTRPLQSDARVLDWVRGAHASSTYTTSVCTGSLVLGAAGLLDGLTATTHWARYADLEAADDTLEVVAGRCGLGSAESLRRVFHRHLGVSPDAYRRRFRTTTPR